MHSQRFGGPSSVTASAYTQTNKQTLRFTFHWNGLVCVLSMPWYLSPVTCESMMTVSTRRVCHCDTTRYATIRYHTRLAPCLCWACFFTNMMLMCQYFDSGTVDLPIDCCCPCPPKFVYLQWCLNLNLDRFSKFNVRRPSSYPSLAHNVLLVPSLYVWSRSLFFQWAGLWSTAMEVVEGSVRVRIIKLPEGYHLVSYVWRALFGGH